MGQDRQGGSYFQVTYFSKSFSFKKANRWVEKIADPRIRFSVGKKLRKIKDLQVKESGKIKFYISKVLKIY